MLRIFLSLMLVLNSAPGWAASPKIYTPVFQRRAMDEVVSQFTSSLSKSERQRLFEDQITVGRLKSIDEKSALLNELAIELVDVTGRFVRAARAEELSEARDDLRKIVMIVTRAASANAVFSKQESSLAGGLTFAATFAALFATTVMSAVGEAITGIEALKSVAFTLGPYSFGFFFSGVLWLPVGFRIPGTTKLMHAVGLADSLGEFWGKVGEWMKSDPLLETTKIQSIEDFRTFLAGELRGISLDRACAGALLAAPRYGEPG